MKFGVFIALIVTAGLSYFAYDAFSAGFAHLNKRNQAYVAEGAKLKTAQQQYQNALAQQEADALRLEKTKQFIESWRSHATEAGQVLSVSDHLATIARRLLVDVPLANRNEIQATIRDRKLTIGTYPITVESTLSQQLRLLGHLEEEFDLAGVLACDFTPTQSRLTMSLTLAIPVIQLPQPDTSL